MSFLTSILNKIRKIINKNKYNEELINACKIGDKNIVELMIDEAVTILCRDIQNYTLMQATTQENTLNT